MDLAPISLYVLTMMFSNRNVMYELAEVVARILRSRVGKKMGDVLGENH